jgi:hypothetical protein
MLNVPTLITSGTNLNLHAELDQSSDSSPLTHSHSSLDAHPTSLRESHPEIPAAGLPDTIPVRELKDYGGGRRFMIIPLGKRLLKDRLRRLNLSHALDENYSRKMPWFTKSTRPHSRRLGLVLGAGDRLFKMTRCAFYAHLTGACWSFRIV